ncbi:hypothetical protein ACVWZM_000006 [Bradyrhizobium sp. USDA 4501]
MALDRQIARLSRILVDREGITFDEAQTRLRALTLEIVVGPDATSPAAHAAVLTAVSVGSRTFVGGVRVAGATDLALNSALPLAAARLGEAALEVGASHFEDAPSQQILIGTAPDAVAESAVSVWWQGWRAGIARPGEPHSDDGENPLSGVAAGALAVGAAFQAGCGRQIDFSSELDLWPVAPGEEAPRFEEIFLPGAIWLVGLGNLGQAFLWALASLPYADPANVSIMLQDRDKVTEENWATSVLVRDEAYGALKTKIAEEWATAKKFDVRRTDRHLLEGDRLEDVDPRVALCGVDKIEARKIMGNTGFDCIVDAGLGRRASDFDRYRVTIFDSARPIRKHFEGQTDEQGADQIPDNDAYQRLEAEVGRCGTAEVAGASVAAPYVSAVAATVAVSRLIAIASGCPCRTNEVRRLSEPRPRTGPLVKIEARGARHAGRPPSAKSTP